MWTKQQPASRHPAGRMVQERALLSSRPNMRTVGQQQATEAPARMTCGIPQPVGHPLQAATAAADVSRLIGVGWSRRRGGPYLVLLAAEALQITPGDLVHSVWQWSVSSAPGPQYTIHTTHRCRQGSLRFHSTEGCYCQRQPRMPRARKALTCFAAIGSLGMPHP